MKIPNFSDRCHSESTRDAIFLFQRREWRHVGMPTGHIWDSCLEGVIDAVDEDNEDRKALPWEDLLEMDSEDDGPCVVEIWHTERVFGSREEGEAWGNKKHYNYPDGRRVYCVPAEGGLASLLKSYPKEQDDEQE